MFSGVTAVTRLPIGAIRDDANLVALCQAAAMEGMAVAHAKGVSLPVAVMDQLVPGLQALPQARPPGPVEVIGHDFQDDDVVPLEAAFGLPQALSRAAGEGGEAAKALGQ